MIVPECHCVPYGRKWSGRVGRQEGWEGVELHSYDPDNTQRKTVASSNNGVQAQQKRKGKRERGKENERWGAGKRGRKKEEVGMKN